MDLLTIRDCVYHRIQQNSSDDIAPVLPATSIAQQALRAWKRRLRSVGGDVTTLIPPSGALEWASPVSNAGLSEHGQ